MSDQKRFEIGLSFLENIGPITARTLVSYCGSVEAVFKEKQSFLLKIPGIGQHRSALSNRDEALVMAENELEFNSQHHIASHFYLDESYPTRLKAHEDSPIILFTMGDVNMNADQMLAVVGTRKPTDYGKVKCEQFIQELKAQGVTIVSGLAYGIDATAHKASVNCGLPTLGVLGNGLPKIYPAQHKPIVQKMIEQGGGVISQFPSTAGPDREHFPMRNKTVAYMTDATLVIESKASGGSMITANFAFHNNKELFALPGRSIDLASEGCNKLIKANMAQLVTKGEDIVKSMFWDIKKPAAVQSSLFLDLNEQEQAIVSTVRSHPEIHIDELAKLVDLNHGALSAALLQLELKNVVKQLAGKKYMLVDR